MLRRHSRLRHAQRGSTAAGVLVGLLIGGVIAAAVALYIIFGPKPFVNKVDQAPRVGQELPAGQSGPVALPGKPGDAPMERPKFDFYKILPGGEEASAPVVSKPAAPAARIFLQAGAFQNPLDADNLRARLALMSVESNVQRVDLSDKGVFYRVRVGPFDGPEAADAMRARLLTEGIDSNVVRPNQP
ncbi:MAG: SPOR domain-containing protein [Candidatus Dactylopiibacterium sp.]|nr:SPOR domain-containing protein [Candidatus Dactylopiibacterium sp.]